VIKLTDKNPPEYRLRVGGWRVRFAWEQASDILIVLYVFKRGQGYEWCLPPPHTKTTAILARSWNGS